jgi:hypothetical protein
LTQHYFSSICVLARQGVHSASYSAFVWPSKRVPRSHSNPVHFCSFCRPPILPPNFLKTLLCITLAAVPGGRVRGDRLPAGFRLAGSAAGWRRAAADKHRSRRKPRPAAGAGGTLCWEPGTPAGLAGVPMRCCPDSNPPRLIPRQPCAAETATIAQRVTCYHLVPIHTVPLAAADDTQTLCRRGGETMRQTPVPSTGGTIRTPTTATAPPPGVLIVDLNMSTSL